MWQVVIREWLRVNAFIKGRWRDLGRHLCVCPCLVCSQSVLILGANWTLEGPAPWPLSVPPKWLLKLQFYYKLIAEPPERNVSICDAEWKRKMKNVEKWQSHYWLSCPTWHPTKCFLSVLSQSPQWPRRVSAVSVFIFWVRKLKPKYRMCPRSHSLASLSGWLCHRL